MVKGWVRFERLAHLTEIKLPLGITTGEDLFECFWDGFHLISPTCAPVTTADLSASYILAFLY